MAPPAATIDVAAIDDTTAITAIDPLTLQGIAKRRLAAGKLVAGLAAKPDLDLFKSQPTHHEHKPAAKRWDHRLTLESRNREANKLKSAAKYLKNPGMISLGGGLPSSEIFPFEEISFKTPAIGPAHPDGGVEKLATVTAGKNDMLEEKSLFDIATAFNYGLGTGSAQLLRFFLEHTELIHNPPYRDWQCTMTIGSTSALEFGMRMFCDRGDCVLTEEYSYSAMIDLTKSLGCTMAGIGMDAEGMDPVSLDETLSNWDEKARGARKPFVLYTVPTGQNPAGATQSEGRRRAIYKIAQKHDLYIFEDEPYYFLQMAPYTGKDMPEAPLPASHEEFLRSLVPSYLSMDTDGRVMRIDSCSKVIAPGSRLGWITASEQIIDRYVKHADVATQGPSGFSQLVMFKLLDEHWGHAGYLDWLIHLRAEYTRRRNVILDACEKYLPKEVLEWTPPTAGMFHWLQVMWTKHPSYGKKTVEEIEEDIFQACIRHGALCMKGSFFYADPTEEHENMFLRTTYAAAPFASIDEAIRRVGVAFREEFRLEAANEQTNGNGKA